MNTINTDTLLGALNWRYAVKKFDSAKKLTAGQVSALEEALRLSPSSFGLQPWKFMVVTDSAVREQLTPASWGQSQIADCSHLVVFAAKNMVSATDVDQYVEEISKVRGVPKENLAEYAGMMKGFVSSLTPATCKIWTEKQCYIALGNLLTCAAVMGIDACPMEGIEPAKYNEILKSHNLGEYSTVVVAALGYRAAGDMYAGAKKVRFAASQVVVKV